MSNQKHSDVVSDDGSWSDVYNEAQTEGSARQQTGESSHYSHEPAASTAVDVVAGSSEHSEAMNIDTSTEQDNSKMVDHRSAAHTQINGDIVANSTLDTAHSTTQAQTAPTPSLPQFVLDHAQNLNASADIINQIQLLNRQTNPPGQQSEDEEMDFSDTSSSTDSSSSDDSDDSEPYELHTAAELAEMLMREDHDEDDGDDTEKVNKTYRPRTANEAVEEAPPRPTVVITPDMILSPLGWIKSIAEGTVVVQSSYHGVESVLKDGTLVTTEDRRVIGLIADTFGKVEEPMYTIPLGKECDELVKELGLAVGVNVTFSKSHSFHEETNIIRAQPRGTDASNVHDEEVDNNDDELSDDELELEYKKHRNYTKKSKGVFVSRVDWLHQRRLAETGIKIEIGEITGRANTALPDLRPTETTGRRGNRAATGTRRPEQNLAHAPPPPRQGTQSQQAALPAYAASTISPAVPAFAFGLSSYANHSADANMAGDDTPRESFGGLANIEAERRTRDSRIVLDYGGDGDVETPVAAPAPAPELDEPYQVLRRPDNYASFAHPDPDQNRPRSSGHTGTGNVAPWLRDNRGRGGRGRGRGRGHNRGNHPGQFTADRPRSSGQQYMQQPAHQPQGYQQPAWPQQMAWQMPQQQAWPQQTGWMPPNPQQMMMHMMAQQYQQNLNAQAYQQQQQGQNNGVPPPPQPPSQ